MFIGKKKWVRKDHPEKRVIDLINENENFGNLFNNGIHRLLSDLPIYGTGNLCHLIRE